MCNELRTQNHNSLAVNTRVRTCCVGAEMDFLQLVMGCVRGTEGAQAPVVVVSELNTACDFRVCYPTNFVPAQHSTSPQ